MRQGSNSRRQRNHNSRKPHQSHQSSKNQTFDSNAGDVRVRGNAYQILEKYLSLARDSTSTGDRITAENYLQHAEHYYRTINMYNDHHGQQDFQREKSYDVETNIAAPHNQMNDNPQNSSENIVQYDNNPYSSEDTNNRLSSSSPEHPVSEMAAIHNEDVRKMPRRKNFKS
ncbi:MAG: DUF4167 domain-containing protein [Alphaproteobacteria bacterium]|nr:DUF4167 domain-containing protein [Alphaproteobacteria bacterium]